MAEGKKACQPFYNVKCVYDELEGLLEFVSEVESLTRKTYRITKFPTTIVRRIKVWRETKAEDVVNYNLARGEKRSRRIFSLPSRYQA